MTLAICIKCGAEKFGAYVHCAACNFRPTSEEDLAKSMMVTDHYFSKETLGEISHDLSSGKPVQFSEENLAQLISEVRKSNLRRMLGLTSSDRNQKRPWWKFWAKHF